MSRASVEADRVARRRYNAAAVGLGAHGHESWRQFKKPSRTWLASAVYYEQRVQWDRPSKGRVYR